MLITIFVIYGFGYIYFWFNDKEKVFSVVAEVFKEDPRTKVLPENILVFISCFVLMISCILWPYDFVKNLLKSKN
jgi:hypothetical protein